MGRGLTDGQLLEIMDLRENEGLTSLQIANAMGLSKNTVVGAYDRIRRAVEPSKHDRTMPYRWWRAGLRKQDAKAKGGKRAAS